MANYKKLPKSKVSFSVKIEKKDLDKAQKTTIARAKNDISIKGFRKGQAPDDMVISYIGPERLAYESLNIALDKAYRDFVTKENIAVISAPEAKMPKKQEMPMKVEFEVEVFPEVKIGNYQKLKIKKPNIKISDKEVDDVLKTVCAQAQIGVPVSRKAKDGDLLEVDFCGKDKDGNILPNTDGKNHKFRIGMGQFLPDLEKGFIGMKAGEDKKAVKVKFPKEYHAPDMAGKTIPFDIKLHNVFEVDPSKLTKEDIKKISGKEQSLDDFKKQVKQTITANKSQGESQKNMTKFNKELAKLVKVELPESWITKEINARIEKVKSSPQYQHDPESFWKKIGKTEEILKKEAKVEAEIDLKVFLGLSEIIKLEKIELDKDEMERAHEMVHHHLSNSKDHNSHAHHAEMDKAILNLKIDKYILSITE